MDTLYLKEEFVIFVISLTDTSKYAIIRTENGYVIDRILPDILTFKECSNVALFSPDFVILNGIR